MLNIGVNLNVDVKKTSYPIKFQSNICVHCGAQNSMKFVDIFGRETTTEIHPFDHLKCTACGTSYSISWNPDLSGKMFPTAVEPSIKNEFLNLISTNKIKKNGVKKL